MAEKSLLDTPIQETDAWQEYMRITNEISAIRTNPDEVDRLYTLVGKQYDINNEQYEAEKERWRQTRLKELEKAQFEAQARVDAIIDD